MRGETECNDCHPAMRAGRVALGAGNVAGWYQIEKKTKKRTKKLVPPPFLTRICYFVILLRKIVQQALHIIESGWALFFHVLLLLVLCS